MRNFLKKLLSVFILFFVVFLSSPSPSYASFDPLGTIKSIPAVILSFFGIGGEDTSSQRPDASKNNQQSTINNQQLEINDGLSFYQSPDSSDSSSNLLFNYNYIPCVISLQDKTGALILEKGDGIDITDGTITKDVLGKILTTGIKLTNSDRGTAQNIFKEIRAGGGTIYAGNNSDYLEFLQGTGISMSTDIDNNKITFSSDPTLSGWTVDGTVVRLTTSSDNVGIGTARPGAKLEVAGSLLLSGATRYVNFNATSGDSGYGFKDNSGTMQYKNSGGSWANIGAGGGGDWIMVADIGTAQAIGTGSTASFLGGVGIGTSISGADELTIYGTYTASNGLTLSTADFKLGGTLTALTKIDQDGNDFGFFGSGNVGIGTTNPAYKLEVNGSLGVSSTASFSSYVGIGTSVPTHDLDVAGDMFLTGIFYDADEDAGTLNQILSSTGTGISWASISDIIGAGWILEDDDGTLTSINIGDTAAFIGGVGIGTSISGDDELTIFGTYTASNGLTLSSASFKLGGTLTDLTKINQDSNDFGFFGSGSVGIGNTNPGYKLHVVGDGYFSTNLGIGGTATAADFSGSGASLTNIPESAITDGSILARVASNETITGDWDMGDGMLQIPNSTSLPGSCEVGDIYADTDADSGQRIYLCESADSWVRQGGLWTDSGSITYLTSTTNSLAIGGTGPAAKFYVDGSGNLNVDGTFTFGDGTTGTDKTLYADNGTDNKPYLRYEESSDKWLANQGGSATPDQDTGNEFEINYNSEATPQTWTTPYRQEIEFSYASTTTVNVSAGAIRLNGTWYAFTTSETYGDAVNGVLTPTQTMGQVFAVCAEEDTGALKINMYKMMENTPATDIYKWDEAGYYLGDHNTSGRCQSTSSDHTSILLGYFSIGKTYAASGTDTEVLRYSIVNNDNLNGKTLKFDIPLPNMVFTPNRNFTIDLYESQVCAQTNPLSTSDRCSGTDWGSVGTGHTGNVVAARSKYNVYPSRGVGNSAAGLTYHDFIWAGEVSGKRLPTDAEWSRAAQYGLTRSLPLGTTTNMPKGNNNDDYGANALEETGGVTANRDIYNELGLCDLNGNLWEYVDDSLYWGSEYTRTSQFGSDYQYGGVVLRGGSWSTTTAAGVFARFYNRATYGSPATGARLAR